MIAYQKPKSFYPTFDRKAPGTEATHYCPGCGHGNVHKLIAEAIDDFDVQDRVIFMSPVGCSVFAYYYFDTGNVQCAHGRAPAVASALRRVNADSIIISYQGDGDLAGIGTAEIIHAANRGENITVYFVNNAIYGMTGGQMAPTTLIGQRTATTPFGRDKHRDGGPLGMAEIISAIPAAAYVERVSLADGKRTARARRAVRKGLQNQIDGVGFSFVEILSPCPINWKKTPREARDWIRDVLEPVFPLGLFVDRVQEAECSDPDDVEDANVATATATSGGATAGPARATPGEPTLVGDAAVMDDAELVKLLSAEHDLELVPVEGPVATQAVKIAGFGGQGVLSAGVLLANCAIASGLNATWLPSYGPEMRGGTANAGVIISGESIGSPVVDKPTALLALNGPSLEAFAKTVVPGGIIVRNSSIVQSSSGRTDVTEIAIPASDIAKDHGFIGAANVAMLVAYATAAGFPAVQRIKEIIPHALKKKHLVDTNLAIVEAAETYLHREYAEVVSAATG